MVWLDRALSTAALAGLAALVGLALAYERAGRWEGYLRPVVGPLQAHDIRPSDFDQSPYVDFAPRFEKLRSCKPAAVPASAAFIVASAPDGRLLLIEFPNGSDQRAFSRPTGVQSDQHWRLHGTRSLDGVRMLVRHDCHPLWTTATEFFGYEAESGSQEE